MVPLRPCSLKSQSRKANSNTLENVITFTESVLVKATSRGAKLTMEMYCAKFNGRKINANTVKIIPK